MGNRMMRLCAALAGATLIVCGLTHDAGAAGSAAPPAAAGAAVAPVPTRRAPAAPAPLAPASAASAAPRATQGLRPAPARGASASDDPYRCHPSEDIACTVVRETPQGVVIATLRGVIDETAAWSVVSGAPPRAQNLAGGTVYVIPAVAASSPPAPPPSPPLANGAPILD